MRSRAPSYLSFGDAVRLMSEEYFLRELAPLGMSNRAFRSWMRCLQVPLIYIGDYVYVDILSVQVALRAMVRVGGPEKHVYVPGSKPLRVGGRGRAATHLNISQMENSLRSVIRELLLADRHASNWNPTTIRQAAWDAASRMVEAGLQHGPPIEQEEAASNHEPPDTEPFFEEAGDGRDDDHQPLPPRGADQLPGGGGGPDDDQPQPDGGGNP